MSGNVIVYGYAGSPAEELVNGMNWLINDKLSVLDGWEPGGEYQFKALPQETQTTTVTVTPKKVKLSKVTSSKSGQLKITWKADTTATGYEIQYSTKSNFKKAVTKTVAKNTKTSLTIKKLTRKKKYYVRIRAYSISANNQKIYGAWSKTGKQKIK